MWGQGNKSQEGLFTVPQPTLARSPLPASPLKRLSGVKLLGWGSSAPHRGTEISSGTFFRNNAEIQESTQ
jgi:hypothetical protein